ncbi:hypothetical protein ACFX13_029613 [Malus domestica]
MREVDRPHLPQVAEAGSSSNKLGSSQEGGRQSSSFLANTDDVISVIGDAEWGKKKGMVSKGLEMSSSPLKKIRGPRLAVNYPGMGADLWRRMSVQETCLVVERAFITEDERRVGQCEAREQRDPVEEVLATDQKVLMAHKAGKFARGGGGWPSTAANQP